MKLRACLLGLKLHSSSSPEPHALAFSSELTSVDAHGHFGGKTTSDDTTHLSAEDVVNQKKDFL